MAFPVIGALLRGGFAAMRNLSTVRRVIGGKRPARKAAYAARGKARRRSNGTTDHEIGPWRVNMNLGPGIASMGKNMGQPKRVLDAVGLLLVSKAQQAFREEKFGGVAWPERRAPNVFGIIADLSQGNTKTPPMRRFQTRPVLFDKGALLKSLSYRISGTDTVLAGSWLPYAGKHQYGGETESLPITEQVQEKLQKFIQKRPWFRAELGWLLNKKYTNQTLKSKVPARPFVGMTKELQDEIVALVGAEIMSGKTGRRGGRP